MLIMYEFALLLNRKKKIPVIPLFIAEMIGNNKVEEFDFAKADATLPDVPHAPTDDANKIVSELR